MNKPSQVEIINHLCDHFGLTLAQALEAVKTPTHPATLRDEFAGLAMQGLLAYPEAVKGDSVAARAYAYADAMLAERIKPK